MGVQNWKFKSRGSEYVVNGLIQNTTSISPAVTIPGVAFPYDTVVSGPADFYDSTYRKFSGSWQQRLTERTHLEVAGAYERKNNTDWQPIQRGDTEVFIDNNYHLPAQLATANPDAGKPLNPYFGVPYLESNTALQKSEFENQTISRHPHPPVRSQPLRTQERLGLGQGDPGGFPLLQRI